jgi:hypothetical protein
VSAPRSSRLRSPLASLCAAVLTVATASVVLFTAPQAAGAATRSQVLASAYSYGHSRGYHVGIAVLDTKTGKTYHAGDHSGTFASESVVKVMIATRVYLQGRLHGTTKKRVYKMITQSDDQIASSLYPSVGGDHLITWIKKRFKLPHLGSEPRRAGWWGNTHITPDGMVALYGKLKKMSYWGTWLIKTMSHATKHGSDGFYQWFGLKSANSHAAIKQGWGTDYDNWSAGADENTTGFVNGNRYAIAILARGPARTYGGPIGSMLTATAKRLLPGGAFPALDPVLTTASAHTGSTNGGQVVVLHGRNLTGGTRVYFGVTRARLTSATAGTLRVVTPREPANAVRIHVVTNHGSTARLGPVFRFTKPAAPPTPTAPVPPPAVKARTSAPKPSTPTPSPSTAAPTSSQTSASPSAPTGSTTTTAAGAP